MNQPQSMSHYDAAKANLRAVHEQLAQLPQGTVRTDEMNARSNFAQAIALAAIAEAILTLTPDHRTSR